MFASQSSSFWKAQTSEKSVKKTGKVLVLDTGFKFNSISSEIITQINENCFTDWKNELKELGTLISENKLYEKTIPEEGGEKG